MGEKAPGDDVGSPQQLANETLGFEDRRDETRVADGNRENCPKSESGDSLQERDEEDARVTSPTGTPGAAVAETDEALYRHRYHDQFFAQHHPSASAGGDLMLLSPGSRVPSLLHVADATGVETALGGAAYAGELLALRSALSEKELELLELQQAYLELAGKSEEMKVKTQRAMAFKADATRQLEEANKSRNEARAAAEAATEKARKMQAELRAAREGGAAAREELRAYREKLDEQQKRAAAAELAISKAQSDASNARHERDTLRRKSREETTKLTRRLEEETKAARGERDAARSEAKKRVKELEKDRDEARAEVKKFKALEKELAGLMAEQGEERKETAKRLIRAEEKAVELAAERDVAIERVKRMTEQRQEEEDRLSKNIGRKAHAEAASESMAQALAEAKAQMDSVETEAREQRKTDRMQVEEARAEMARVQVQMQTEVASVRAEAQAEVAKALAEVREQEEAVARAQSQTQALVNAQHSLKVKVEQLVERVGETQRYAASRAAAASRHKEVARDLRRQLGEMHTAFLESQAKVSSMKLEVDLQRKAVEELRSIMSMLRAQVPAHSNSPVLDLEMVSKTVRETAMTAIKEAAAAEASAKEATALSITGAVEEVISVLASALKSSSKIGGIESQLFLQQWTMINAAGESFGSGSGGTVPALLSIGRYVAESLVTLASRAVAAENANEAAQIATEEARENVNDLNLELASLRAEFEAMQTAAQREAEAAKGWEDAAAHAESAWTESQQELREARAQAAEAEERTNIQRYKLESTINKLSETDQKNAQLDQIIQRLATRSFGPVAGNGLPGAGDAGVGMAMGLRQRLTGSHDGVLPTRHHAEQISTNAPVYRGRIHR